MSIYLLELIYPIISRCQLLFNYHYLSLQLNIRGGDDIASEIITLKKNGRCALIIGRIRVLTESDVTQVYIFCTEVIFMCMFRRSACDISDEVKHHCAQEVHILLFWYPV